MIGFNHAAAGGIIAKYLPLPIAVPLALLSHFVLDALPHYGIPNHSRDHSVFWRVFFVVDFILALTLGFFALFVWRQPSWFWCGLLACSPDFLWVARVVARRSFDLSDNQSRFTRWHVRIQRYERPWGIYIVLPLAFVMLYVVMP